MLDCEKTQFFLNTLYNLMTLIISVQMGPILLLLNPRDYHTSKQNRKRKKQKNGELNKKTFWQEKNCRRD